MWIVNIYYVIVIYYNYNMLSTPTYMLAQTDNRSQGVGVCFFMSAKKSVRPSEGAAEGGVGGIPPAELSQFRSDIFKQTPPNFKLKTAPLSEAVFRLSRPGRERRQAMEAGSCSISLDWRLTGKLWRSR